MAKYHETDNMLDCEAFEKSASRAELSKQLIIKNNFKSVDGIWIFKG